MNNWRSYRNYSKRKNDDGSIAYIITVDGVDVEVGKEVYAEYASSARQMEYMELDLKRDRTLQDNHGRSVTDENGYPIALPEREISLEKLMGEDWDFPADELKPEDAVMQHMEHEGLYRCLDLLNDGERALVEALFFNSITEREYAQTLGISKTALHARKIKVLAVLKILLEE